VKKKTLLQLLFVMLALAINVTVVFRISNVGASSSKSLNPSASPAPCVTATPSQGDYNLEYHCGEVMVGTIVVHPIYWFPAELGFYPGSRYINLLNRYYNDVDSTTGGQNFFNTLTQYADKNGNKPVAESFDSTSGYWIDTVNSYPETPLTSQDLANEIQRALTANPGWSPTHGYSVLYPIFVTKDECWVNSCGDSHGNATYGSTFATIFTIVPYGSGNLPGTQGYQPPNFADGDRAVDSAAHEEFEAITDPDGENVEPTGWWTSNNSQPTGGEIADKCEGSWGNINSDGANHVWSSDEYIIQEMWSNNDNGCVQTPDS